MTEVYSSYDGTLQGTTTVVEDDAKEYIVRYPRDSCREPFTVIFREKKRPI